MADIDNNCRLCLCVILNKREKLNSGRREMLRVISLNLDLNVTNDPLICHKCQGTLQRCFDFKTICLNNEVYLKKFSSNNRDVETTLEEIVPKNCEESDSNSQNVCRLCLTYANSDSLVKYNSTDDKVLKDMLNKCLNEIELDITKQLLICRSCIGSLQAQFTFMGACLDVEEELKKYILSVGMNSKSRVDLSEISKHIRGVKNDDKSVAIDLNYVKIKNVSDSPIDTSCKVVKLEDIEQIEVDELHIKIEEDISSETENDTIVYSPEANKSGVNKELHCPHCPFKNKRGDHMQRHIVGIHEKKKQLFVNCAKCMYRTPHKGNLMRHMKSHNKTTKIKCLKCQGSFDWGSNFKLHVLGCHPNFCHPAKGKLLDNLFGAIQGSNEDAQEGVVR